MNLRKKRFWGFWGVFVLAAVLANPSVALADDDDDDDNTRLTSPNAISIEGLGRGLLWSINYDRAFGDHLVAGVGLGTVELTSLSTSVTSASASITIIPIYVNYNFSNSGSTFFGTVGADIISGTISTTTSIGNLDATGKGVVPTFGLGYESRSDSGFLFRGTLHALVGNGLSFWPGFSLGYSF